MFALESYFHFKICEQIYHCPISQQTLIPFTGFSRILFAVRSVAKAVCVCDRWSNLRLKQNKSNMSLHCKHYDLYPEFSPYIEICTFSLICLLNHLCVHMKQGFSSLWHGSLMKWFGVVQSNISPVRIQKGINSYHCSSNSCPASSEKSTCVVAFTLFLFDNMRVWRDILGFIISFAP